MATGSREEHPSPRAEMASSEADAKMVVATSRDECEKLKDLVRQQDATTMLVVMASSKEVSQTATPATMHPLLASAACRGNWEELNFLLNREGNNPIPAATACGHHGGGSQKFRNQIAAYSCGDVEQGTNGVVPLLKGITLEGDTALHLVAANGDAEDFLKCADLIHSKNKELLPNEDEEGLLLSKRNSNGDTPLHCAARAGRTKMVSHLIGLSRDNNIVEELLRKENNSKETALHEAVRIGNSHIVEVLLEADHRLACFPENGSSALYLAILQRQESIAQALYDKTEGILSYSGPDGQNALHAAVLRSAAMVEKLLDWNEKLTSHGDCNGSTPLHFLSSRSGRRVSITDRVLEANLAALYQPDKCGLFPIHLAASAGNEALVAKFISYSPSSAGLRDSRGRTFLHVAAKNLSRNIVAFACKSFFACKSRSSLVWILNMQDHKGNTALHLAVKARSLQMVCFLLGNQQVHINITNKKGQTPFDIAFYKIPSGMHFYQISESMVHTVLWFFGGRYGCFRRDHLEEKYIQQRKGSDYEKNELEKLKDSTQTICIGSVLIATVAFSATFALPGGYKADDHTNGGTPTLAGRYAFDAFIMANTLAFICSAMATVGFMFSGTSLLDLKSRWAYYSASVLLVSSSVTSLTAAFALGVYMVLAPVAHKTAIAIVTMSPLVMIFGGMELLLKSSLIAQTVYRRMGLITAIIISSAAILLNVLFCWPLVVIFGWAAIARNH